MLAYMLIYLFGSPMFTFFYSVVLNDVLYYLAYSSNSYTFANVGFCVAMMYVIMCVTGLSIIIIDYHHIDNFTVAFLVHGFLVGILFLFLYIHMMRMMFVSFGNYQMTVSGLVMFAIVSATAAFGYISVGNVMSYWAAVVIVNILNTLVVNFSLGANGTLVLAMPALINKLVILHMLIALLGLVGIAVHFLQLHVNISSCCGMVVSGNVSFHVVLMRDLMWFMAVLMFIVFTFFVFADINLNGGSLENTVGTPANIVPEWYYLYLYIIVKVVSQTVAISLILCYVMLLVANSCSVNANNIVFANSVLVVSVNLLMLLFTLLVAVCFMNASMVMSLIFAAAVVVSIVHNVTHVWSHVYSTVMIMWYLMMGIMSTEILLFAVLFWNYSATALSNPFVLDGIVVYCLSNAAVNVILLILAFVGVVVGLIYIIMSLNVNSMFNNSCIAAMGVLTLYLLLQFKEFVGLNITLYDCTAACALICCIGPHCSHILVGMVLLAVWFGLVCTKDVLEYW